MNLIDSQQIDGPIRRNLKQLTDYVDAETARAIAAAATAAAAAASAYVNVTGDAMTGQLTIHVGGASDNFRIIGDGAHLTFWNATQTTRWGYLQGNNASVVLSADTGKLHLNGVGGVQLSTAIINNYTMSEGVIANRVVLAGSLGYIFGNYINMTANVVASWPPYYAGQSGDNYMRWYLPGTATFVASGQIQSGKSGLGGFWGDASFLANPGAGTADIAFHAGGIAPVLGCVNGAGDNFYHRNANFTSASASAVAAAFVVESSGRWKSNVNSFPMKSAGAAVERPSDLLMRVRPVTFEKHNTDIEIKPLSPRRVEALHRLHAFQDNHEMPRYEFTEIHDCAIHECRGTAEEPCSRVLNRRQQRYGLIAEELREAIPEATVLDADGSVLGIDYAQVTAVTVDVVQELVERIAKLEKGNPSD